MEKWKSRTDREIPTFPQPIGWVQIRECRRTDRINRPRVVYFPSGVLVYFLSGAPTETVSEYAYAATLAIEAGFDGIELHGANGYLIEQFLNANLNTRSDGYGGSVAGRNRFAIEVARATAAAIGADRVGIRISPYGAFNVMGAFPEVEPQYLALVREFSALRLAYVHLVDHSSMGAPAIPASFKAELRAAFNGVFIGSGGLDRSKAEQLLKSGDADLVAFGRPALANPDLVARLQDNAPLNPPDFSTFYTPGEKGYTDYPALVPAQV